MTESPTSLTDALRSDHSAITRLLDDSRLSEEDEHGLARRADLVAELVRHYVAEEQYLAPTVRHHLPDGDAVAEREFSRDRACEKRLRALEDDDLDTERLAAVLADVRTSFAAHVTEQEAVFATLERTCDTGTLAELGEGVLGAEQLAPTRPRHLAPESPAVNKVASLVSGFVDHVRDHYAGRGVERE